MRNLSKYFDLRSGNPLTFEVEAWIREIDFLIAEIAYMKTLLAMVVDVITDQASLDMAEMYQNKLLDLEMNLNLSKENVKKHKETIMLNLVTLHPANEKKNSENHDKLRKDVHDVESSFITIKDDFNIFVTRIYTNSIN